MLYLLDADTLIRELSGGARSLDDFARAFLSINDGSHVVAPYTFEDVVAALNAVQPYDWAAFLRTRLDGHGPGAPLDGLAAGGVYGAAVPNAPQPAKQVLRTPSVTIDAVSAATYERCMAVSCSKPGAAHARGVLDGPIGQAILDKCANIYRNELLAKIPDGTYDWEDYVEREVRGRLGMDETWGSYFRMPDPSIACDPHIDLGDGKMSVIPHRNFDALSATGGNLGALCPECEAWMNRRVRLSDLDRLKAILDVTGTPADEPLRQPSHPSVNHDSEHPHTSHAEAQP